MNPFADGITVSRTVTSSSANVALGTGAGASGTPQVLISSPPGGNIAFIKWGTSSAVTAALTDTPILPGVVMVLTPPAGTTHVAAIGSATTTLYFTTGHGE